MTTTPPANPHPPDPPAASILAEPTPHALQTPRIPSPPRTRLAPSPTGALHLGNARTFLITHALAVQNDWDCVLRIEDLDTPRVKPGSTESILAVLRHLGVAWSPSVLASPVPPAPEPGLLVQTHDLLPYRDAIRRLAARGLAYPCDRSRTDIASAAAASAPQAGAHEAPYPAELRPSLAGQPLDFDDVQRQSLAERGHTPNWRFLLPQSPTTITDLFVGRRTFDLAATVGDFILWTKRDQPAYQLAVVVDDHRQSITHVVRGDDLLDSAARQLLLYRALNLGPEPAHIHLPLVLGPDGLRLAKRHGDSRLDTYFALGVPPAAVLGLLAHWCLPGAPRQPISTPEFVDRFRLSTLSPDPVTFTPQDDAWLRSFAR